MGLMENAHRLAVHLPLDRTLEEVILARKVMSTPGSTDADNPTAKRTKMPSRGMLASPSSPANYLSRLPPESYVRDIFNRTDKPSRSRLRRQRYQHMRDPVLEWRSQSHQRPVTSGATPSTVQVQFQSTYNHEGLRPKARVNSIC